MVIGEGVEDLDALRQRFIAAQPLLERVREHVEGVLRSGMQERELRAVEIDGRVKDVASFVKKALRKGYDDPWNQVRDKVGVRLTATYPASIRPLEGLVQDLFVVHTYEDKRNALEPNELDYLGSHFEVSLRTNGGGSDVESVVLEIQIHTAAEGLWAGISHELLYKPADDPPAEVARALYRLLALVELFDLEVGRARDEIMKQPSFPEGAVLRELERHFFALTAHRSDTGLSRMAIKALRPLYSNEELLRYAEVIDSFVNDHRDKLEGIYRDYLDDVRNPLMSQPESLLVFERLERNFQEVAAVWSEALPARFLRSLANVWGKPIDSDEE